MMDVADMPAAAAADCAPGEIAVSAVSKWFDTPDGEALTVLQNISVAVPAQSIFAILGASGCGKSTLLNVIAGILKPDRGNVCFGGVPSSEFTDWRSISYMLGVMGDEIVSQTRDLRRSGVSSFQFEAALDQFSGACADHVACRMQGHRR